MSRYGPVLRSASGSSGAAGSVGVLSDSGLFGRPCCFGLFKGGFEVNLATVSWYRSSCGTDFDSSEIARPVFGVHS